MTAAGAELGLVQKTVTVVQAIAASPHGLGLSELARQTGIAKATCYRILAALEEEGWLFSDAQTRRFNLSLDLVFMTESTVSRESATRYARDLLGEVAAATGETSGLDRLSGDQVMVLVEVPGPHLIGHAPRQVPRVLSSWRTSTGRVLLAFGDRELARVSFERDRNQAPHTGLTSFSDLEAELDGIRRRGHAVTQSQLEDGLTAIAVPVFVGDSVPYALWTSGPSYRIDAERITLAAAELALGASRLGALLGRSEGVQGESSLAF